MALGPIPWRDILVYAEFHEIDDQLFPVFKEIITTMDATYRRFQERESKGSGRDNAPPKKPADDLLASGEKSTTVPHNEAPRRRFQRGR